MGRLNRLVTPLLALLLGSLLRSRRRQLTFLRVLPTSAGADELRPAVTLSIERA